MPLDYEIEAKFLKVDFDDLRQKLESVGARCEQPMRLMRRVLFDHQDERYQKGEHAERLRVRDEGDKVCINYKRANETNYVHEIEVEVGSFDEMVKLFESIGLMQFSYQETKRETWKYKDIEVVLDEWPWLSPFIEIEGPSEKSIKLAAKDLGFDWKDAKFGSSNTAYKSEYPGLKKNESIGDVSIVTFDRPVPKFLMDRK